MTDINREFIDTNILVYAYNVSAPAKQTKAKTLLTGLWNSRKGCLSLQVLQEFYTVVTRKTPSSLPPDTAALIISDYGNWPCHTPDVNDLLEAIRIQQRYDLSFWDALIIWSAVKLGCKIIWSEDFNHGQIYEGINVLNPFFEKPGKY